MPDRVLRDSYGRPIGDLRVSITDRCNFRCTYCIPVENIQWKKKSEIWFCRWQRRDRNHHPGDVPILWKLQPALRVTADGQLRTCLFSVVEHDLKTPMRNGARNEELRGIIAAAVWGKEAGHRIGQPDFAQPARTMSCIGG